MGFVMIVSCSKTAPVGVDLKEVRPRLGLDNIGLSALIMHDLA
jgi:hypothetical protein